MRFLALLLALAVAPLARADEGMWTFNNFPSDRVAKKYGFRPDQAWLDHVRLSSARLAQGCSASFVSANGLVMTNHHCAHSCIEELSTPQKDLVKAGFYAATPADEVKCPDLEVNQLVEITDVTARMKKATEGLQGQQFFATQRGEMAKIEAECQTSDDLRCEVVSLYRGGVYDLYKYRRFQDVRLVFAPEFAIAFFGGDPDNFMFPRYDLDVAFLRVYDGAKPATMEHFLRWSKEGAKDGELTFISGNPGNTSRQLTVAQLEYQRDVVIPDQLIALAEQRGYLGEYQHRGPEEARHSNATLFYVENSFKARRGGLEALQNKEFFQSLVKNEERLRAKIAKDPARAKKVLPAYAAIESAITQFKQYRRPYNLLEGGRRPTGFAGDLFHYARTLVRGADERTKPGDKRLREYRESALPAVTQELFSTAPVYAEFEILRLTHSLTKLREELGADHPTVKKVLGKSSPAELADRLVKGTKLADPAYRKQLWNGGKAAIDAAAATDPMIELARRIDGDARALRDRYENEYDATVKKNAEIIARARFDVEGKSVYPDATFTPRLTYGQVKGWTENGRAVNPITTFGGAFERHTGREPFALPESWLQAEPTLAKATPFDFVSDNDIIGGNSGSPVVNKAGEVVGLVFDGNIHSLGGDFGFDPTLNRAVSVHSAGILEALKSIYKADRVVKELEATSATATRPVSAPATN
ncbi:MAG TPA: S46 family peptidase [Anaeromyxobacteraceae bacterium]|nr:S46 family peptidase [Anaeromyxobacteraceae bacterium]